MFGRKSPQVLVAGGGPVGLLAAAALARRKVPVTVVDAQWTPATRSYALALHARSLELLADLDLLDALLDTGHRIRSVGIYDADGRRAEIDLSRLDRPEPCLLVVGQDVLERALADRLDGSREARLLWNHRLRRFDLDGGVIRATVDRLGKDSGGYGTATTGWVIDRVLDWSPRTLLGADGHGSATRRSLGVELDGLGPAQSFGVFECRAPGAGDDTELKLVLGSGHTSVLWPMGGDRCRWSFQIDAEAPARHGKSRLFVEVGGRTYPHLTEERLHELLEERAPWWDATVEGTEWAASLSFDRGLATSFARGPVVLLGDAAHLAGPVAVRSMNAGLEEAVEVADLLAHHPDGVSDELELWGAGRRRRWTRWISAPDSDSIAGPEAPEWVREHRAEIFDALPATGVDLEALLAQVGLARATD